MCGSGSYEDRAILEYLIYRDIIFLCSLIIARLNATGNKRKSNSSRCKHHFSIIIFPTFSWKLLVSSSQTVPIVVQARPRFTKELQNDSLQLAVAFASAASIARWALFAELGKPLFHRHRRRGRHDGLNNISRDGNGLNINIRVSSTICRESIDGLFN